MKHFQTKINKDRSIRSQMFFKNCDLKNFAKKKKKNLY